MQTPPDRLETAVRRSLDVAAAQGVDLRAFPLVVGVSGGPDSTALLHALRPLWPPGSLVVAHLDHGLRPDSADDAAHVAALALDWNLRFIGERLDVGALARERGLSLEEAARSARYAFLAGVARQVGAPAVAVGHHAGDQAETVLMHILRGSGLAGLRGMPVFGPMPDAPDVWLWRPLLALSRADIESYCREQGLTTRADPTNADTGLFRNRLRHDVLPFLEDVSPRLPERLNHLAVIAAADDDLLRALEETAWKEAAVDVQPGRVTFNLDTWRGLPLALRRRLLRRAAGIIAPDLHDLGFVTLEAARLLAETGQTGAGASLPGELTLLVSYDRLIVAGDPAPLPGDGPQLPNNDPVLLQVPGMVALAGGWRLTAERVHVRDRGSIAANPNPWLAMVATTLPEPLQVRPRRPGERLQPLGLNGHYTKIKELLIDRKVPAALRGRWPIVATADHPVWIAGHVLDHRARLLPDATEAIRLRCLPPDGPG
jgi:tRNA(Ile)-lysidine synthase